MVTLPNIGYKLKVKAEGAIKLSHCHQLVAAFLGFKSCAAYEAACKEGTAFNDLTKYEEIMGHLYYVQVRCFELKCSVPASIVYNWITTIVIQECNK